MIPITGSTVSVDAMPTDGPESDGTLEWSSTTVNGMRRPDRTRPGPGLELQRAGAGRDGA